MVRTRPKLGGRARRPYGVLLAASWINWIPFLHWTNFVYHLAIDLRG